MKELVSVSFLLVLIFNAAIAFSPKAAFSTQARSLPTCQEVHKPDNGPGSIQRPDNEFSRLFPIHTICRHRDYFKRIEATEEERNELIGRVEVLSLQKLEADVEMRQYDKGMYAMDAIPLEVEGTIRAHVTQVCSRTADEYEDKIEFPFYTIVKPVKSFFGDGLMTELEEGKALKREIKREKERRGRTRASRGIKLDEINIRALQDLVEVVDDDENEDIFEDEGIYKIGSNRIDIGELIVQLLILQMDSFPVKPGQKAFLDDEEDEEIVYKYHLSA